MSLFKVDCAYGTMCVVFSLCESVRCWQCEDWYFCRMWPLCVSVASVNCFPTNLEVSPGHELK